MGLAEFVVSFREVFEIALVIGIMLAYLHKTKNWQYAKFVYAGVALAVGASLASGWIFESLRDAYEANEALFEGIMLVLASVLVTWLILWMFAQKNFAKSLEQGLQTKIGQKEKMGLVAFAFISVFREGIELVIFLGGIAISTGALNAYWAAIGGVAAIGLAFAIFRKMIHLDLGKFFLYTSAILVLLAAGLLSQGVHELQEASVLPTSIERIYDITPAQNPDGSYPLMHEKGAAGGLLKGLVGYDTAPSLEQAGAYVLYLVAVFAAYRRVSKE
ncbi:MAG: FTR1 family protein [Candidatus Anstonellaceae archaeon]